VGWQLQMTSQISLGPYLWALFSSFPSSFWVWSWVVSFLIGVSQLKRISADKKIQSSVNPKRKSNDLLRELGGWFDSPEVFNTTREQANLLHALSESAILALKTRFSSSYQRPQVVHWFCNMMALTDQPYLSLFKIKVE